MSSPVRHGMVLLPIGNDHFRATCLCGWLGVSRRSEIDAQADWARHGEAEQ